MKNNFYKDAWEEYLSLISKFIPYKIQKKFFTKKIVYITLAIVTVEIFIILYFI